MSSKINLENLYIAFVFSLLLFLGLGSLWNHQLKHDFPYGYFASDAFQHQSRAEGIKDEGSYRYEPFYNVFGVKGVIGYYPPIIYHLAVLMSYLSGLEVYDTIYFIPFFFSALAAIVFYFIIRKMSVNAAILSMPLTILLFYKGAYTGFTWGTWPSILSQFFLVAFFWSLINFELEKDYFLFAFFLSAVIMTHTSEAFFAGFIAIALLVYKFLRKELSKNLLKKIVYGIILTILISSYYLTIFKGVWMVRQPYTFSVIKEWGAPTLFLADFKFLLLIFGIGILSGIMLIKNKNIFPFFISLLILLFSYGNYAGFGDRAFQLRYYWGIYLSVLLGLGLFQISKIAYKKWSNIHSIILGAIIFILIAFANLQFLPSYSSVNYQGMMDSYHWDILKWMSKNTDENAVIYFFYGDVYNQDAVLRGSKRTHKLIIPQDYADAIQKKEFRRYFETESPGDGGGGAAIRKGIFNFEFKLDEMEKNKEFEGKKDICKFDYYVFDKRTSNAAITQYNLLFANELIKKDFIKIVHQNDIAVILKNSKTGEDCIEQRAVA